MNRRRFLQRSAAAAGVLARSQFGQAAQGPSHKTSLTMADRTEIPDEGWLLWIDEHAAWQDDPIFLPDDVNLATLPANPPTGGWNSLETGTQSLKVTLPSTVEQHLWGQFGARPYTPDEYRYAADDAVPQNGAYRGVSWWSRQIEIPAVMKGKRIFVTVRGARMRAEVYLNQKLVGYSIMEELPFECDLTSAAQPGGKNRLAIRITNPGGRYDWVDGNTIRWGKLNLYRSHGFGGLDRGLTLHASPSSGRIVDAWALNTPQATTIHAFATLEHGSAENVLFEVFERFGKRVAYGQGEPDDSSRDRSVRRMRASLSYPQASVWDLSNPVLYRLRTTLTTADGQKDVRETTFGFRWFGPEGLGTNALFRLNGRRTKLYTAISWGFWGLNGLWPTPELAEREVKQAKRLGLNCLNFHRNVGKEDLFNAHDSLGLLRYMEPGGGKLAIGKLPAGVASNANSVVMQDPTNEADRFSQRFMLAKCRAMVRAFRSHPSLIQYTLQNEIGADLNNPRTFAPLEIMHEEDPSRSVVLNDGFSPPPRSAPQAWFAPYNDTLHRSDKEPWGGWWNNHQGAGDQWYDEFYKDSGHFTYRQPLKEVLVEFGEMEGCAVADNHPLMIHQITTRQFGGNGKSYDLADHQQILAPFDRWLDRWGFRKAFPSTERFYSALGDKCYASWQQYMENARICDEIDFAAISGWESTAIENHSGIVDNLRNFKGNPDLIAGSLSPIRPVAKQHRLCYATGESAVFDLYLLNDTGKPLTGNLNFSMTDPAGTKTELGSWPAPQNTVDQFSYPIQMAFKTPPLTREGVYLFRFHAGEQTGSAFTREIWVTNTGLKFSRKLTVAVSGILPALRRQLASLANVEVLDFRAGERYDLIVASGIVKGSKLDRAIGDETGLEAQPAKGAPVEPQVPGHLPEAIISAVQAGTPLLAAVPEDSLADGVAKQLAALGAFTYSGQVGDTRAPWMGNWLFVREHPTFAGMPASHVLGVHYQARGKSSNGLLIDAAPGSKDLEVIMGYSRDHDRQTGAASFLCHVGQGRVLVHRAPEFNLPLQLRWLGNAVAVLTGTAQA